MLTVCVITDVLGVTNMEEMYFYVLSTSTLHSNSVCIKVLMDFVSVKYSYAISEKHYYNNYYYV